VVAPSRPIVGLTAYRQTTTWWSWERDAALVPGPYLDAVESAGGVPVVVPPSGPGAHGVPAVRAGHRAPDPARVLAVLDAVVLVGGGDLDPARYGQTPDARSAGVNGYRDELEIGLVQAALRADLPVLAVCRGLQVLNVALGGELVQHLPGPVGPAHQPGAGLFAPVSVATEEGSEVRRLYGERAEVLCSHHQAVGRLAPGLAVTARSGDGVVEAVEMPGRRFVVGVQWHPEEAGDTRLFRALVEAADPAADAPRAVRARTGP